MQGSVIPVFSRRLSWRLMWLLCSFQGPRRGIYVGRPGDRTRLAHTDKPADAGLSKLNSMLDLLRPAPAVSPKQ